MQETYSPKDERVAAQRAVEKLVDDPDAYGSERLEFMIEHFFRYEWIEEYLVQIQELIAQGEDRKAEEARKGLVSRIDQELERLK